MSKCDHGHEGDGSFTATYACRQPLRRVVLMLATESFVVSCLRDEVVFLQSGILLLRGRDRTELHGTNGYCPVARERCEAISR